MSIWGILFFIVLALWLLYEYIILMGKLYLKYLMITKLKKELLQAIAEVKKNKTRPSVQGEPETIKLGESEENEKQD